MKHYVLGFVFDEMKDEVLLVQKKNPPWQAGRWNGIGGKIEEDETSSEAIARETREELNYPYMWQYCFTFVCPGGTVFVFRTFSSGAIVFSQMEDEMLRVWPVDELPTNIMNNLKWIIPVCLSNLKFPFAVEANTLGNK